MKNQDRPMISANEINRFMYCPYQWYYKRHYGHKYLQEQYKAMGLSSSNHENNYTKGTNYHSTYHRRYRFKRLVQMIVVLCLVALLLRGVMLWAM